jgi:hypothetical protein
VGAIMTDCFTTDPASFEGRMLASPETRLVMVLLGTILGVVNAIRK